MSYNVFKNIFNKRDIGKTETAINMLFITFSGGLQDAYSYMVRGGVFANAQTGNIVLMGQKIVNMDFAGWLKYFFPVMSFAMGVFAAENLSAWVPKFGKMSWRQIILIFEVILLFIVSFMPPSYNNIANAVVSFSCAMQLQAFRQINGHAFASTMCIGNLRSGVEALSIWVRTKDVLSMERSLHYFFVIAVFATGAGTGAAFADVLGGKLILVSCVLLLASFFLMFEEQEPKSDF